MKSLPKLNFLALAWATYLDRGWTTKVLWTTRSILYWIWVRSKIWHCIQQWWFRNYSMRVTVTASFRSYLHCCPLGGSRGTEGSDRLWPEQCWVFAHCLCFFVFACNPNWLVAVIIYKATGSAHYFRQRIKAYIGDIRNPIGVIPDGTHTGSG